MVQLKQINLVKWGGAILLAMMMALVFIPSQVFAEKADDIKVFMTVSYEGVIAQTNDGKPMAWQEVTVEDLDESGDFSFNEALVAAHKAYNSADGYLASGDSVKKLWGKTTTNNLFYVNGGGLPSGVSTDKVVAGDYLVASVNKDESFYSDWISQFDQNNVEAIAGEEITLNLQGHLGMAWEDVDKQYVPLDGIQIGVWNEGEFQALDGVNSNAEGDATIIFDEPGTYVVTAQGTTTGTVKDYYMMGITHDDDDNPVYGWMDYDTYDCIMAYTERDYGEGPYPADEVQKTDQVSLFDLSDFDFTSVEGYFLRNNSLLVDAPIIAPACIVKVAGEPADVTMTVSNKGVLAQAKDGSAMVEKKVTVEDLNYDGKLSYDEALVAAHEEYCSAGGDGLVIDESPYGGKQVTKLWSEDTTNTLLFANGDNFSESVDAYVVEAGDDLYASINKDDTYYADFKTAFVGKDVVATTSGEVTVSLLGRMGMAWDEEGKQYKPLKGIQLGFWKDGAFEPIEGAVTDEEGKCTFSVKEEGEYLLTAQGTVESEVEDYSEWPDVKIVTANCPTMAPYCNLEITKSSKLSEQKMEALNELMVDYDLSNYDLAEQVQVLAAINAAQGKILTAESTDDIEKAMTEAREYLERIKTSDVKKAEKKAAEAKEIKKVKAAKITGIKVKAGKKKATVKWKKNTTFAGYQIQYKTGKAKAKTVKVTNVKTVKKVIKKLKKGKKYSFKVRGYKKIGGKVYYGKWSKVVKKKIK